MGRARAGVDDPIALAGGAIALHEILDDQIQTLARRGGNTVCQDRRIRPYFLGIEVVPDGQDDLGAAGLAGD